MHPRLFPPRSWRLSPMRRSLLQSPLEFWCSVMYRIGGHSSERRSSFCRAFTFFVVSLFDTHGASCRTSVGHFHPMPDNYPLQRREIAATNCCAIGSAAGDPRHQDHQLNTGSAARRFCKWKAKCGGTEVSDARSPEPAEGECDDGEGVADLTLADHLGHRRHFDDAQLANIVHSRYEFCAS